MSDDLQFKYVELVSLYEEVDRRANRRLKLLRRTHEHYVKHDYLCPICHYYGCSEDCELAREISDAPNPD